MTIRGKLILTCATLVASSAVLAGISYCALDATDQKLQVLASDAVPGVRYAQESESLVIEYQGNCWKHISNEDPGAMAGIERTNADVKTKLDESLRGYEGSIHQTEDRDQFTKVREAVDRYFHAWEEVLPVSRAAKNQEATARYMQIADPAFQDARRLLDTVVKWNVDYAAQTATAGTQTAQSGRTTTVLLAMLILAMGVALAVYLIRSMTARLRTITSQLSQNANQVAGAASQIASSSQILAQNASEQAASLEETSAAVQTVSSHVRKNVATASELTSTMAAAVPILVRVNGSLDSMVESMGGLNTSSQKIASIVKVIDEIAFQTNILALNAAVEAARSGEAGMGFAVVADEVRNLAHRSAQAAKETGGLIEESVRMVRESSARLDVLIQASRENGVQAGRVKELVDNVTAATQQQAQAIDGIAHSVPQLEQATQHIAANAEEGAAAAAEMTAQSSALQNIAVELTAMMGV